MYQALERRFVAALCLGTAPVGVTFLDQVPRGVPRFQGAVPAGCRFWKLAAERAAGASAFYTLPTDHHNCSVGSYTHNIDLTGPRAHELGDVLQLFAKIGYVKPEEVPAIPRWPTAPAAIKYERLADATSAPDVALGFAPAPSTPRSASAPQGPPVVIEIAARTIGGLCARTLRFGTGLSLEELILRHALGQDVATLERQGPAAGVMMIPIPCSGVLKTVEGVLSARVVPGIEDVVISVRPGQNVLALPEGASYLGFIFARAETPAIVEAALRAAHARLSLTIAPTLPRAA
jgi:hypothetical protein